MMEIILYILVTAFVIIAMISIAYAVIKVIQFSRRKHNYEEVDKTLKQQTDKTMGDWQFGEPDNHGNRKPYCPHCGEYHLASWNDYKNCKYCPNCGEEMIGRR